MHAECKYCGRIFKTCGLKLHQNKCKKKRFKRREFCFESKNVTASAHFLSYLSNQPIVKLQAATGARYAGGNASISAICCPCENDELVIADGLCLASNKAKDPTFRETITTTEARKLYGLQPIDSVPHKTRRVYQRGYYCLFKYADLERYAVASFGSKIAWLEHFAPKALRRQKTLREKRKAQEEYRALIPTFPSGSQHFVDIAGDGYTAKQMLKNQAERYDAVSAELASRCLCIDDHLTDVKGFVLNNSGYAEQVVNSIDHRIKEKERMKRVEEESGKFLNTLSKKFVSYLGYGANGLEKSDIESRHIRYHDLTAGLRDRNLYHRSDSELCRNYVKNGEGVVDDIVDTMEEMKFLFAHTSYAVECSKLIPIWSYYDCEDDDWIPVSVLRERSERIKCQIRDKYILDSRGLALPSKWQRRVRPKSPGSPCY